MGEASQEKASAHWKIQNLGRNNVAKCLQNTESRCRISKNDGQA